jgi:hypothetical protein
MTATVEGKVKFFRGPLWNVFDIDAGDIGCLTDALAEFKGKRVRITIEVVETRKPKVRPSNTHQPEIGWTTMVNDSHTEA